jgi:poly-gamma-glutamate synthesis protein (capsule biosynthesis protein)
MIDHDHARLTAKANGEITLFLAGDTVITQPWSADRDPAFLALVKEIHAADVAIVNLEMLFHRYRGYAQSDSGGTYMAARPEIALELAWAGIDMVANANNHTFDYGSTGVLEHLDSVARAGLVLAGAGRDLQAARAPAYLTHPNGTVALISAASSYIRYGKASRSRPDMHGRPGLNPLTVIPAGFLEVPEPVARVMQDAADRHGVVWRQLDGGRFEMHGRQFRIGSGYGFRAMWQTDAKDVEANLVSVRQAAAKADLVILSVHAHQQGPWLTDFAHQAIEAGTDVFFAHGPHRIVGIEIYKGKPIFYGLGNFVFQNEQIERLPSEFYERFGLGDDATPEDAQNARSANGTRGFPAQREPWEAVAAVLRFKGKALLEVRLLPMELGFGKPLPIRGKPRYADAALGEYIIGCASNASHPYGTRIHYLSGENAGVIDLE